MIGGDYMLKLLKYFKPIEWFMIALTVGLVVLQVELTLAIPEYLEDIIELIGKSASSGEIWKVGGIMITLAACEVLVIVVINYLTSHVGAGLARTIRRKVFGKVEEFSMQEISKFSTSSLITRCTNDISQIQSIITMCLRMLITAPIMGIGAIFKIFNKSKELSLATMIAIFILVILIVVINIVVVPKFKLLQKSTDDLNMITRENLTGLRVIRAFNTEDVQEEKFDKINKRNARLNIFVNRVMSILFPGMNMIMNLLTLAIVWVGASLVNNGSLEIGILLSFSQYSMHVLFSFLMLSMMFIMIPRAMVSAGRINEVLSTPIIIQSSSTTTTKDNNGEIKFDQVSFAYPSSKENVLDNISFDAKPGEIVAFIGSTGSGKSTLINLIPRFFDSTSGNVYVDGVNVKDYDLTALRNKIGYVPQKTLLFSGTIRENLLDSNPNATEEEMWQALDIAQAKDFVQKLEGGLDYNLAQGATNVSGGQKQRLSIARAIIRHPEILIFDDSFSALDYKTDQLLRSRLAKELNHITTLIVGQRIGTIMNADKIIVLDEGKIVGIGTHKELMKNCPIYQEIAYSQLSKKELENG